jgi:hypothetical protein
MAAVVAGGELDLTRFRKHLGSSLPAYARPVFLRIRKQIDLTGTFKYSKTELIRQAYDPEACDDALYFDHRSRRLSSRSTRSYTGEFTTAQFVCKLDGRCGSEQIEFLKDCETRTQMHIDQIRDEFAKLEAEIADGPIVPHVTVDEIRAHLESRLCVQADHAARGCGRRCGSNAAEVAGAGHPPALFRLYTPQRYAGWSSCRYAGGHVQPAVGQLAHFPCGKRN